MVSIDVIPGPPGRYTSTGAPGEVGALKRKPYEKCPFVGSFAAIGRSMRTISGPVHEAGRLVASASSGPLAGPDAPASPPDDPGEPEAPGSPDGAPFPFKPAGAVPPNAHDVTSIASTRPSPVRIGSSCAADTTDNIVSSTTYKSVNSGGSQNAADAFLVDRDLVEPQLERLGARLVLLPPEPHVGKRRHDVRVGVAAVLGGRGVEGRVLDRVPVEARLVRRAVVHPLDARPLAGGHRNGLARGIVVRVGPVPRPLRVAAAVGADAEEVLRVLQLSAETDLAGRARPRRGDEGPVRVGHPRRRRDLV